jgi:hypothetical protein
MTETGQIDWTMRMCMDMYKLASAMQCPVVKDMIVDKIREIYLTYCEEQTEQDFDFPLEFGNSLSSDEDAPILRLLSDILNDGSRKGQDHTHDEHSGCRTRGEPRGLDCVGLKYKVKDRSRGPGPSVSGSCE